MEETVKRISQKLHFRCNKILRCTILPTGYQLYLWRKDEISPDNLMSLSVNIMSEFVSKTLFIINFRILPEGPGRSFRHFVRYQVMKLGPSENSVLEIGCPSMKNIVKQNFYLFC